MLDTWYETAGVRAGVRRLFRDETDAGKVFFPARLVPYLAHEALTQATPQQQRELTLRHLYQFLLSTAHLETRIVNRAAERIANGRAGIDLAMSVRLDAFKVYCDEGYHALYSLDLAEQIAKKTGIAIPPWDYGGFVDRLEQTGSRLLPDVPHLVRLLQAVVFETLITAVLNEIPPTPPCSPWCASSPAITPKTKDITTGSSRSSSTSCGISSTRACLNPLRTHCPPLSTPA